MDGRLIPHRRYAMTRRDFLAQAGAGFGFLALGHLLAQDVKADIRLPHVRPRARSVIWLFMDGGPSHIDTFDPKPELQRLDGQRLPASFKVPITPMGVGTNTLMASRRTFRKHGQSGLEISDWFPHLARHADELCVIRSCWANGLNHVGSVSQMNTGAVLPGRPSLGAWVSYGLGSENENLPAFVVLLDGGDPPGGSKNWGAGFLPASYQGTRLRTGGSPILYLTPPEGVSSRRSRAQLEFVQWLNRNHLEQRPGDTLLEARIRSYELAFRMQAEAPEAVDLSQESRETLEMYGLDDEATAAFGRNCLLARRLVERGVRFVQLYCGSGSKWDAHTNLEANHSRMCRACDRPIAALLSDLKRRGLLDETLVVWGGEFGRTPMSEKRSGRDHNPYGFTIWMAGGGVKGGTVVGATDEIGLYAVENPVHVHDIHATIMYLLGLDHRKVTFLLNGRDERATVDGGRVVREVLA